MQGPEMITRHYVTSRFEGKSRVAKGLKPHPRTTVRQRLRGLLQTGLQGEDGKVVSILLLLVSAPYLLLLIATFGPSALRMLLSNGLPH